MLKARILLALGTWVTILQYLGFPSSWKDVLYVLSGLGLIFLSYFIYRDYQIKENKEREGEAFDNFSENDNFSEKI
jgi:hypothetical protein